MAESGSGEQIGVAGAATAKAAIGKVLSWFGMIGGAFTVFSNVSGFFAFAAWVRDLVEHWRQVVDAATRFIVDMLPLPFAVPPAALPYLSLTVFLMSIAVGARLSSPREANSFAKLMKYMPGYLLIIFSTIAILLPVTYYFNRLSETYFGLNAVQKLLAILVVLTPIWMFVSGKVAKLMDRRWPNSSKHVGDSMDVLFSLTVICWLSAGHTSMWFFIYAALLSPFILIIVSPTLLAERCWKVLMVALSFVAVAAITMLPVPPDLAISGLFERPREF